MAFCGKIGGLLRQGMSQNVQSPMTSLLNSVRYMSSSKLFVGGINKNIVQMPYECGFCSICVIKLDSFELWNLGLSYGTDDQSLRDAFAGFGDVVEGE